MTVIGTDHDLDEGGSRVTDSSTGKMAAGHIDAGPNDQIRQLRRKVFVTGVAAVFGPVLALVGVVFTGLQWKAAERQLDVMRSQVKDADDYAELARRDTERALRIAESQAASLSALAKASTTSVDVANRQWRTMDRQATLLQAQVTHARESTSESAKLIGRQLVLAETQASSMQTLARATEDTAEGTKLNSSHTRDTVGVLQQTLHTQERAWLTFSQIEERRFYVPGILPYKVRVELQNVGRTPARNVKMVLMRETADVPGERDLSSRAAYYSFVGPGEKFHATPIYIPQRSDAKNGIRYAAYIHGQITYEDIFGKVHQLNLCYTSQSTRSWRPCRKSLIIGDDN